MSPAEWESLCDGCGKCCLIKLEDEDSGKIDYTDVVCRLLNLKTCRCRRYKTRAKWVPDCVVLTPENLAGISWMPSTCAYRLLYEGKNLPAWHPLLSGDLQTPHKTGQSVLHKVISEKEVKDEELEDHIVKWPA